MKLHKEYAIVIVTQASFSHFDNLQAFAKEGAQVTATDINGEKLKELDGVQGETR